MTDNNDNQFMCSCGKPSILNQYLLSCTLPSKPSCHDMKTNHEEVASFQFPNQNSYKHNEKSLRLKMKEEFLNFCYNSTIRGVPRIAKSKKKSMRALWVLSFITLLLGFSICIYFLVRQFLDYDVIHPPRVLRDQFSDFPSISLCNARPLSTEGKEFIEKNNWRKPNEFISEVNRWAIKHFFDNGRQDDYYLTTSAMHLSGYLESLSSDKDRESLGHRLDNFVIFCQISYMNGSKGIARPCDDVGKWTGYIHPFYINCAIFNLEEKFRLFTKTMEVYLYLQESRDELLCHDCNKYDIKSQLSGAVLAIDRPETFSNINDKSIILMPGTLTEIRLKTYQNIHISPPYGNCSKDTPKILKMFNRVFIYSDVGCKQVTIQNDIERNCMCVSIEYPYNISSLPFCGDASPYLHKTECDYNKNPNNSVCVKVLERILKNLRCKTTVTEKYYKDHIVNCTLPCSFLSYESDRSTSMWPTKSYQMALFDQKVFRQNRLIHKPEFKPYRTIRALLRNNKTKEASKILDETSVLEKNLLAILINKPNFNLHKVEEKEVLSLTSFLSQIGGLGSIWIGLTMISIVEILELILQLITLKSENSAKKHSSDGQTNQSCLEENKKESLILFAPNAMATTNEFGLNIFESSKVPLCCSFGEINPGILKCEKCNNVNPLESS